jgi:hypothetical protein
VWVRLESNWNSHSLLVGIKNGAALCMTIWQFLAKVNMSLSYNSAIVLSGIYPNELKTDVNTQTCTWRFLASLYIIIRTWKQPKFSLAGECINKLWCSQTVEYYLAPKRNGLSSHEKM